MNSPSRLVLGALTVLLLTSVPPGHAASGSPDDLIVPGRISLAGTGLLTVDGQAAVHYHGPELPSQISIKAEGLTIEYAWEAGRAAGPPGQENFFETVGDQGRVTEEFTNATISVGAFEGSPEILAYPDGGNPRVEVSGTGEQTYGVFEGPYLTRAGVQEDGEATNGSQTIGFWYQPVPGWSVARRSDEALVERDFSVFLNNLTVTIQEGDETVWRNWTGYSREEIGPAASSFERHLLKVHVTNGTLALATDDAITVLAPRLHVDAMGVVTAATATGVLSFQGSTITFANEPLRMEGQGSFEIAEASRSSVEGLTLSVDDDSRFDVHGGERVEVGSAGTRGLPGPLLWAPLSLLALLGAVAVAHRTVYIDPALKRWRTGRYAKWMTRGRELVDAADYGGAVSCFRRAARAEPTKGVAWYHLAIALLEDGQPLEVLGVIDEARDGVAVIDELDFLVVEAEAARQAGDFDRCRAAVTRLSEGSEAMARSLVGDLALGEEILGRELARRLSPSVDDGGLQGYA